MIIDKLENAEFYYGLGEKFKTAFEFLKNTDLKNLSVGKHEIQGKDIYVSVDEYNTKPEKEGKFEAHKKYIDIQFFISGEEKLGYENIENCKEITVYDEERDIVFLENTKNENHFAFAKTGMFLIFAPQDAHMPCISINSSEKIKKAVVKIKL